MKSTDKLQKVTFGAKSSMPSGSVSRTIGSVASSALSKRYQCEFMSRLAGFLLPKTILELGTSFGISAAYLHAGAPLAKMTTVEGDSQVAGIAQQTFDVLGLDQIQLWQAEFDDGIAAFLSHTDTLDLVFIDGNHTSTALIRYFEKLKPHFTGKTIVLIDDLYWSADMQHGWKKLIGDDRVTQSVDCFHFGLLFFSKDFLEKQNHVTRLPWPW